MAAPSNTTRSTPSGKFLEDGHPSKIAFARKAAASFWEKQVTPPGIDGGDPIETTTMHNTTWRTMVSRQLKTLTPFTVTAAYDPVFLSTGGIDDLINQEGSITIQFPDGSDLDFYGYLQKAEFGELVEGTFPEVTLTICPTNFDPTNDVEASPVLTSVAGT